MHLPASFWYLTAICVVFLLSFWAYRDDPRKHADLLGVSVMLTLTFAIGNLLVTLYRFPDALLAFPVLDLSLAAMIYRSWVRSREGWKVAMVACLVGQLVMHMVVIGIWKAGGLTQDGLFSYVVGVNCIFIVQLLTLAIVGGGHAVRRFSDWLSRRWRHAPVSDGFQ